MPRQLTFKIKGREYATVPVKIDRNKLYGRTGIIALDDRGRPCVIANTDDSGTLIIPQGGTGLGVMSPDGLWVERSELITVDEDGDEPGMISSSYLEPVKLERRVDTEFFLDHSITSFYKLQAEDIIIDEFSRSVGKSIYTFDYTYRDSYEASPAFILSSDDGLFMLVGRYNDFRLLALEQSGAIDIDDEQEEEIEEIDFAMF